MLLTAPTVALVAVMGYIAINTVVSGIRKVVVKEKKPKYDRY